MRRRSPTALHRWAAGAVLILGAYLEAVEWLDLYP
jgi:hypothetical protein